MFSGKKGLFTGCFVCLGVLIVFGVNTFFCMVVLLACLPVIFFIGKQAYGEIKIALQAHLSALPTKWKKLSAKKQPTSLEKAKLVNDLHKRLYNLKQDMDAWTSVWHVQHSNQQKGLIIPTSYRAFASELQALAKSLNHLGKPGDDA